MNKFHILQDGRYPLHYVYLHEESATRDSMVASLLASNPDRYEFTPDKVITPPSVHSFTCAYSPYFYLLLAELLIMMDVMEGTLFSAFLR